MSEAAFFAALEALERAAQADPEDALVLALLSAHCIEDAKMMYFTVEDALAKAFRLARRAVRLEPDLQRARFVLAYNHLHRREFDRCREHAERALASRATPGATSRATSSTTRCSRGSSRASSSPA